MKPILISFPVILYALAAAAQTAPNIPKMPSADKMPMAAPNTTSPSVPSSGTSTPGAGATSNPIDQAKIEAECKIPTNVTKKECIELMLKK